MSDRKINIVTLGCSKNLSDTETLAGQLNASGIKLVFDSSETDAKTVIINTCGFIKDAKEESINTILDFARAKQSGDIDNLYVMGCLSERYKDDLEKEIPEADAFFGTEDIQKIVETLNARFKKELIGERFISTPKHYAYLKVSEGCNRTCGFCAIPLMRGKHKSVPMDILVKQTESLVAQGVKEVILIAQDMSHYGLDLNKEQQLAELLTALSEVPGVERLRIHYAYPANFPDSALQVMKEKENICNYVDIPLQHISDSMLKKMRRGHTQETTLTLLDKFRDFIPNIAIRTTFLVGYPGETEEDFQELKEFVKKQRFDRLGIFTYSEEEDTYAGNNYEDDIPAEVKQQRADEIMEIQQQISFEINEAKIGKTFKVIIDREDNEYFYGRTEFDSPEVDNEVLISKKSAMLKQGQILNIKVTGSTDFDLYGTPSSN